MCASLQFIYRGGGGGALLGSGLSTKPFAQDLRSFVFPSPVKNTIICFTYMAAFTLKGSQNVHPYIYILPYANLMSLFYFIF